MVATSWTLTIDVPAATRIALDEADRIVVDTTRRVLNRATVLTPVDTGNLRAHNQSRITRLGNRVVGEVFNDTEYADAVHDGTRPYIIRPRRKKALRFVVDGQVVFAKSVRMPGRRGRPWLLQALREIAIPAGFTLNAA